MNINLFTKDQSGQLQPIETSGTLTVIPRVGETVCFMSRNLCATVEAIEYLLPATAGEAKVAVILDHAPGIPSSGSGMLGSGPIGGGPLGS